MVIAGQRSINSNIAIDGADFNGALQGSHRGGNDAIFTFSQTAIQELQVVQSGVSTEIGPSKQDVRHNFNVNRLVDLGARSEIPLCEYQLRH